jgi:hypothetical protein
MEVGGQLHALAPESPGKTPSYLLEDRVCPRVDLDSVERRKISCPQEESNTAFSIMEPVA